MTHNALAPTEHKGIIGEYWQAWSELGELYAESNFRVIFHRHV